MWLAILSKSLIKFYVTTFDSIPAIISKNNFFNIFLMSSLKISRILFKVGLMHFVLLINNVMFWIAENSDMAFLSGSFNSPPSAGNQLNQSTLKLCLPLLHSMSNFLTAVVICLLAKLEKPQPKDRLH